MCLVFNEKAENAKPKIAELSHNLLLEGLPTGQKHWPVLH